MTREPRIPKPEPLGRDDALSFMAHELRTPLTAIIGMADLLSDSQLSPDQRDMIEVMGNSARSLVEIVNDVLDLSKLAAGKVDLEIRNYNPADCVEDCIDLLAATAAKKRLELAYIVDECVPAQIRGDPTRVRRVLVNLLGNAIKFTQAGEVLVNVTCTPVMDDRCELRFAVSDSGPGISPDRLTSIFEPYAQADLSITRRFGGTGLGLPITMQLVALMGGRIWVDSELGEGSSFYFTVPGEMVQAATAPVLPADGPLAGRRLLVAEDSATIGNLLADMAGRWGMDATVVTDAEYLATAMREAQFDLALIDGEMSGLLGRSVASVIHKQPWGSRVPLVLMTALSAFPRSDKSVSDRADERFATYVNKPIKPAHLYDALVRACDGTQADVREPAGGPWTPPFRPTTPPESVEPSVREEGRSCEAIPEHGGRGAAKLRVLVADDDDAVRNVLDRTLQKAGFEVLTAPDGEVAWRSVRRWNADVLLLDGRMPGLDGFEVCRRVKADPATMLIPVLMITGLDSRADRLRGIEVGVDGFMTKPFDAVELLARVRSLGRMKRATDRLERAESVLVAMARCIEGKDPNTHGHCERLSDYATALARRLGLDALDVDALRLAGIVHDIGKVAIPDAILLKPGALDEIEWAVIRDHPLQGEQICSGLSSFQRVLPIIRHHHERMDGTGYPDGLAGDQIPVTARVLQVVDIYDALTTSRPYKAALSREAALEIMEAEVERGWRDPEIVSEFRQLVLEDARAVPGVMAHAH